MSDQEQNKPVPLVRVVLRGSSHLLSEGQKEVARRIFEILGKDPTDALLFDVAGLIKQCEETAQYKAIRKLIFEDDPQCLEFTQEETSEILGNQPTPETVRVRMNATLHRKQLLVATERKGLEGVLAENSQRMERVQILGEAILAFENAYRENSDPQHGLAAIHALRMRAIGYPPGHPPGTPI
jgi:hypothetical protein